ncbi:MULTISPECIES: hypothetical protein [Rhizobium]|uniref:Gfo/Idh/MocA family protein n=1 Tax=Rhizobium TaxID=379 RepID=UPI002FF1C0B7
MNKLSAAKGVYTMIGLQTRANPTIGHMRKLVADGFVGEVLSASVIGSGITWGEELEDAFRYTLDPSNGASMVHVPFAHTMDALAFALDDDFLSASGTLVTRRATTRIVESREVVPLAVADQIAFTGRLGSGALVTSHFRGGLSRATNFHMEINGSKGDLLLTSPVGYVGLGGFNLSGAQAGENLHPIPVPGDFGPDDKCPDWQRQETVRTPCLRHFVRYTPKADVRKCRQTASADQCGRKERRGFPRYLSRCALVLSAPLERKSCRSGK